MFLFATTQEISLTECSCKPLIDFATKENAEIPSSDFQEENGEYALEALCFFEKDLGRFKEKIDALLANGHDINAYGAFGETPLQTALSEKREDFALYLLEKGADPLKLSMTGLSSLHYAAAEETPNIFEKLMKDYNMDPNVKYTVRTGQDTTQELSAHDCVEIIKKEEELIKKESEAAQD